MAQYSCNGKGIIEFREDIGQNAKVYLTTSHSGGAAGDMSNCGHTVTLTKGAPMGAISAVTNHFKKIDWNTGYCQKELSHIGFDGGT